MLIVLHQRTKNRATEPVPENESRCRRRLAVARVAGIRFTHHLPARVQAPALHPPIRQNRTGRVFPFLTRMAPRLLTSPAFHPGAALDEQALHQHPGRPGRDAGTKQIDAEKEVETPFGQGGTILGIAEQVAEIARP